VINKTMAVAVAVLLTFVVVTPHDNPSITVLNSGNDSELVISIPVTKDYYVKTVIYSVPVGDLSVGDTLLVQSEMESTNSLGFNIMQCSYITVADSPDAVTGNDATEDNCYNVIPDVHHGVTPKVGSFTVTEDMTDQYVNLVVYSAASKATPTSTLRIEPDYGRLIVTKITG